MKYKLEIWKYDIVSAAEAQQHLNDMEDQGWTYHHFLMHANLICYRRKEAGEPKYMYGVDVFHDPKLNRFEEEEDYQNFYMQMGWEYVGCLRQRGVRLFKRPYDEKAKPLYETEIARKDAIQLYNPSWVLPLLLFCLPIGAACMADLFTAYEGGISGGFVISLFALIEAPILAGNFTSQLYLKGYDQRKLANVYACVSTWTTQLIPAIVLAGTVLLTKLYFSGVYVNIGVAALATLPWIVILSPFMMAAGIVVGTIYQKSMAGTALLIASIFSLCIGFAYFIF